MFKIYGLVFNVWVLFIDFGVIDWTLGVGFSVSVSFRVRV